MKSFALGFGAGGVLALASLVLSFAQLGAVAAALVAAAVAWRTRWASPGLARALAMGAVVLSLFLAGSAVAFALPSLAPAAAPSPAFWALAAVRPLRARRNGHAAGAPAPAATIDTLRAFIGANTTVLTLDEARVFFEFEAQFREAFGDEAHCLFVARIAVHVGKDGARHFVRAMLDWHHPPESIETTIAMAAVHAARERDRQASAVAVGAAPLGPVLGRRERVAQLVKSMSAPNH